MNITIDDIKIINSLTADNATELLDNHEYELFYLISQKCRYLVQQGQKLKLNTLQFLFNPSIEQRDIINKYNKSIPEYLPVEGIITIGDTESTGLSIKNGDRLIEIAAIKYQDGIEIDRFHTYLNTDKQIHPDAVRVHGITNEFLSDKPHFYMIAPSLLSFIQGSLFITHNLFGFDIHFLNNEFKQSGINATIEESTNQVVDSLQYARFRFPGFPNDLDSLAQRMNVTSKTRTSHDAMGDTELLAKTYFKLATI